ncbi:MAG: glycosyltransferase [Elusimicrobia bacterium]|nr:glycosyltransferase [Elusimicrobiota bacterium]
MKFSLIIAAHNEGYHIGASLKRLRQISQQEPLEVIVVDGGSMDDTVAQARPWADQILAHGRPNRGEQLHLGAQRATGSMLLFLRGDAQLPGNWQQVLEHFWLAPGLGKVSATVFSVEFGSSPSFRFASWLVNAEARWRGRAGLGQGLCTTAEIYRHSGGFPPVPCLEGRAFCERLRPFGRLAVLPERVWPSASRLHRFGLLGYLSRRAWLDLRLCLGATPEKLARDCGGG